MADFEGVVRPFQLPNNAPPAQPYVTPNQQGNPPISLFFGRSGSGRVFTENYSIYISYYIDQYVYEYPNPFSNTGVRPIGMPQLL